MRATDPGVLPKPPERQKNKDTVYPRPTMTNIIQDTCALIQHHHKLVCLCSYWDSALVTSHQQLYMTRPIVENELSNYMHINLTPPPGKTSPAIIRYNVS